MLNNTAYLVQRTPKHNFMSFNYLENFPIPPTILPERLRSLLEPVGLSSKQLVEVTAWHTTDNHGPNYEHLQMLMAVVPGDHSTPIKVLSEASNGVVAYSVPTDDKKGCSKDFHPSISGHDYVVASWGDGSFYTYNLAEKVWMALGLTPRCVGNEHQRIIYDDLKTPEYSVAEGEISGEHYFESSRNISWKMSNKYLRKYLWMRNAHGVRLFFYEKFFQDSPELRAMMSGKEHFRLDPLNGWYSLDIRKHKKGLLLQLWASVKAVSPELCPAQTVDELQWPDVAGPMTQARANSLTKEMPVFLDDKFLQRYEQNQLYDSVPVHHHGHWYCSPSYRGQWSFTGCVRIGRNLVRVPMRELYKPKPDREIFHAHDFAMSAADAAHFDPEEEHIVAKTQRLLDQLLDLGDNLSKLGTLVGTPKSASTLVGFCRNEVENNGWNAYPQLRRLAQVAPLDMSQQAFLARCKSLHEIWQRIPDGFLKSVLEKAGCRSSDIKNLGSLKLLQSLFNITERMNIQDESRASFQSNLVPEGWNRKNNVMAPLFLNNDLRIADAHESVEQSVKTLQALGFDTAKINDGYGRALDFVMDGVVSALKTINNSLKSVLDR